MSSSTSCGNGVSSSYCTCKDYYSITVDQYKYYNESFGVYNCCNILSKYVEYIDTNSPTKILEYVKSSQSGNCGNFFSEKHPNILTDIELKDELPMIYWQGLMNASLFENTRFSGTPIVDGDDITCSAGDIPVFISYEDYESKMKQNKLLCTNKSLNTFKGIKFLGTTREIPYSVFYVKDNAGNDCKTNTCTTKYDSTFNQYNLGSNIYKSSGGSLNNNKDSPMIWVYLILSLFILGLFIYYYFNSHERFERLKYHLNRVKKHLGDKLEHESNIIRDSHHVL